MCTPVRSIHKFTLIIDRDLGIDNGNGWALLLLPKPAWA